MREILTDEELYRELEELMRKIDGNELCHQEGARRALDEVIRKAGRDPESRWSFGDTTLDNLARGIRATILSMPTEEK